MWRVVMMLLVATDVVSLVVTLVDPFVGAVAGRPLSTAPAGE
jgi:hypothetical protein